MVQLSEKLACFVDDNRLAENATRHPEMQREYTIGQSMALAAIKDMFLLAPLVHATDAPKRKILKEGILTGQQMRERGQKTNSFTLDRSLGLDQYTFMHWGNITQTFDYADSALFIDTRSVLLSPNTIVTAEDISELPDIHLYETYETLSDNGRQSVENYLDSIVTGEVWLEIVARRALQYIRSVKKDGVLNMDPGSFGEIKHFGQIPPSYIVGYSSLYDRKVEISKQLYQAGIATPHVNDSIRRANQTPDVEAQHLYGTQAHPSVMKVSPDVPKKVWSDLFELACS